MVSYSVVCCHPVTGIRLYKTVYLHSRISDGASVMGQDLKTPLLTQEPVCGGR